MLCFLLSLSLDRKVFLGEFFVLTNSVMFLKIYFDRFICVQIETSVGGYRCFPPSVAICNLNISLWDLNECLWYCFQYDMSKCINISLTEQTPMSPHLMFVFKHTPYDLCDLTRSSFCIHLRKFHFLRNATIKISINLRMTLLNFLF